MAGNPRIDDLRKRLDRDPGSRLFAQLAEELRKDGELEEAIRVSREGLQKHPAYPSARMTLGRALLDTGDLAAARIEFETVLKGAPDNILASRFLGECLEGLGDLAAARDRFKATLALAPGDKQVTAHLHDLEAKLKKAPAVPRSEEARDVPIPVARVDEPMELERSVEARGAPRSDLGASPEVTVVMPAAPPLPAAPPVPKAEPEAEPPPIPLVAAEEDFELERPFETPTVVLPPTPPPPDARASAPAAPPPASFEPPVPPVEFEFDLAPDSGAAAPVPEPEAEPPIPPPVAAIRAPAPLPAAAPTPELAFTAAPPLPPPVFAPVPPPSPPPRMAAPPPPPPRVEAAPEPEADELTTSTLAELYFNQGFTDKAIEVYRQLLQREPSNDRARTRLGELEALERRLKDEEARAASAPGGGPGDPTAARRQAIERTIARLEGLLTALRKE